MLCWSFYKAEDHCSLGHLTTVGQRAGVEEENRDTEHGVGKGGRKIATHNAPPGRPCCCWRRKGVRVGAVSLVTERGEIMK